MSQLHLASKTMPATRDGSIGGRRSHRQLNFTPDLRSATITPSLRTALLAISLHSRDVFPESCAPFDRMVQEQSKVTYSELTQRLKLIEKAYMSGDLLTPDSGVRCVACDVLNLTFSLTLSRQQLARIAAEHRGSFGEFLYAAAFSSASCQPLSLPAIEKDYFPGGGIAVSRAEFKQHIRKHFLDQRRQVPLGLSDLCIYRLKDGSRYSKGSMPQCWGHELVLTGFREVCSSGAGTERRCRDEIRVHNCWGVEWQRLNNDGWLDAVVLLRAVDFDEPAIRPERLTWIM